MTFRSINVLAVDEAKDISDSVLRTLKKENWNIKRINSLEQVLTESMPVSPQVVLLNAGTGEADLISTIRDLAERLQHARIVVATECGTADFAVSCLKAGACDYIQKPYTAKKLKNLIQEYAENIYFSDDTIECEQLLGVGSFISELRYLFELRPEGLGGHILIIGEQGTGKELVSRNIHLWSERRDRPFFVLDCSDISKEEQEARIFGLDDMAGGVRAGLLCKADRGTLLLKGICELTPKVQSKLVKYLEKGYFKAASSERKIIVDTRIIATSSDLLKMHLQHDLFREDLYYLLNGLEINIPPLRMRKADIDILIAHFCDEFAKSYGKEKKLLSERAAELLKGYPYPGNIAELKETIKSIYLSSDAVVVDTKDLPTKLRSILEEDIYIPGEFSLNNIVNKHIADVLRMVDGNRKEAAKILDISERALYYKLKNELQDFLK